MTEPIRPSRLTWQTATLGDVRGETAAARTLILDAPRWGGHLAGQHVDVRLTAADGYSAQRSYSIASPSRPGRLELTVQRVADGEVSPYLVDEMRPGDQIELRGPIGGWFVWHPSDPSAMHLIGGGSGVVPLMAMIRERGRRMSHTPFRLVYSVRTPQDVFYREELAGLAAGAGLTMSLAYTRAAAADEHRPIGRLRADDLLAPGWNGDRPIRSFVCGPTGFVDTTAALLESAGHDPATIRTERFGPTGGI